MIDILIKICYVFSLFHIFTADILKRDNLWICKTYTLISLMDQVLQIITKMFQVIISNISLYVFHSL